MINVATIAMFILAFFLCSGGGEAATYLGVLLVIVAVAVLGIAIA